jgi:Glycosyl hydrolase family 20, catalytic domain
VKHTGIILDLVNDGSYTIENHLRILAIIDYLGRLGFTLLQLRIMNNYGFAVKLENHRNMFFGQSFASYKPWTMKVIKEIIRHAATQGIQVMPELTVAHHAGGWYKTAHMVNCPKHHCELGKGLTMNTTSGAILPILASVLRELRQSFTSPFIHLGYDEREESMACTQEADDNVVNFEKFERKITRLLEHNLIPVDMVLRWENEEQRVYKGRAGTITHYRTSMPKATENNTEAFITTDLQFDDPLSRFETAWDLYQHVQQLAWYKPLGILASLVTVQDTVLKHLNVRQRLLAVAIGLSVNNLSESEFRDVFFGLCDEVKNNECELYGRIRNSEEASVLVNNEQTIRHTNTCRARVENVTVIRPREGILVENGTNINQMKTVIGT